MRAGVSKFRAFHLSILVLHDLLALASLLNIKLQAASPS